MARAGIRALFNKALEQRWVPVIRVEDPLRTSYRAVELGGRVLIAAGESTEDSVTALLADPSGALFTVQRWPGTPGKGGK